MFVLYFYGKYIVLSITSQSQDPSHTTNHETMQPFLFTEDIGMESGFSVYLGEHSVFLICHPDDRTKPQTKTPSELSYVYCGWIIKHFWTSKQCFRPKGVCITSAITFTHTQPSGHVTYSLRSYIEIYIRRP